MYGYTFIEILAALIIIEFFGLMALHILAVIGNSLTKEWMDHVNIKYPNAIFQWWYTLPIVFVVVILKFIGLVVSLIITLEKKFRQYIGGRG